MLSWSRFIGAILVLCLAMVWTLPATAARIKDIADLKGVRTNQILGYGLVVGLNDTGDSSGTGFTKETLANMLERLNISSNREDINVGNVAAVMVTAELPPFVKTGSPVDVLVSSIGDAESLSGGTLLQTPLSGPDGKVYAVAQGPLSVGGISVSGQAGQVQKNHPTVGRVPDGATVEREVPYSFPQKGPLTYHIQESDFTTISRITSVINEEYGQKTAHAMDSASFRVRIPDAFAENRVKFIADLERLTVQPDSKARVVVNERTGTIVMGQDVRLDKVAVAHGNLKLMVREMPQVSQPQPFSQGETTTVPRTEVQVEEEEARLMVMNKGVNIGDVAAALNAIGATPRDLIAIFQAIKAAGALHAELVLL
ncbi:flagellar basal body P-ring protein FlgI [Desulfohalobium retbaense]|uniref:Flagellar P-ring protein n=1 Tax=Desulfohalobium retbaense (strain ATCC 49708 / DSM 5692 / JCM 16813 / HR100) TaxID=485915 RepID=C8WYX8_DESRD|nr:flagellar basal body P-ring protein FlgI [Desulfohalobium retbaense]ACV67894.1 flagellar P-ring protein [Desulfohalobium retbaense DSM 5692]